MASEKRPRGEVCGQVAAVVGQLATITVAIIEPKVLLSNKVRRIRERNN